MSQPLECDNTYSLVDILKLLVRDADCEAFIDCTNTNDSPESLIKRLVSDVGDGTLALNVCECVSPPDPPQ